VFRTLPRLILCAIVLLSVLTAARAAGPFDPATVDVGAPDPETAAALLAKDGPVTVERLEGAVPGWAVSSNGQVVGWIGSTWEIANTVGYSGRPINVLFAVTPDAHVGGVNLVLHNEPVLTLGISDKDIADYVESFRGFDLALAGKQDATGKLPPIISRATVSTGVIRDGILRSARALALGQGLFPAAGINRVSYAPTSWKELTAQGAMASAALSMEEAAHVFENAEVTVTPGPGAFLEVYAGLIDPPTVGRNLLGQQEFTQVTGSLAPDQTALFVASLGVHSHRGTDWKQTGAFERTAVVQDETRHVPKAEDFIFIKKLALADAPPFKEMSVFRLPATIDPLKPFRVEIVAARPGSNGPPISTTIGVEYRLPERFRVAPPQEPMPLWQENWQAKKLQIASVIAMLTILTVILFAQEWITRRPVLWRRLRLAFLLSTFLVLGMAFNGQLSVVQVIAFLHSLLTGFHWETFLIEPVIFILWGFVALGMLFWGRGVFCGWLCPFGALQELLNVAAQKLGVRQIAVPQPLHERLWVIKYTLFVGILGLSFYSMHGALIAAEVEPFKTAISMRMMRAWPFVVFVLVLLIAGLFIERFYCRYLCALGAGIAIPAKLKIFDWLKRRPQCGRECRLCETKCTVGAIDTLGRINPNECVLCLRCQVIMNDGTQCPVLKRRARAEGVPA
jgi:NosR/NirI family nitrite reductase transcriptional regulator